jgi:hypothetical protein
VEEVVRWFGGSEGRCFGENKETGTSKRRIWARDSGLLPDSWENSSNAKIPIRPALPRSFVEKFLQRFSWGTPSWSCVFQAVGGQDVEMRMEEEVIAEGVDSGHSGVAANPVQLRNSNRRWTQMNTYLSRCADPVFRTWAFMITLHARTAESGRRRFSRFSA